MSDELKAKGNAAFQAKNFPEAIEHFSNAIKIDGKNHVLFSNRSACYASMNIYQKAFEDAVSCTEINPTWAKGYSRLGAALHGMRRYDEAIEAFQKGLKIDPNMAALQQGMEAAIKSKAAPTHPLAQLFTPQLFTILATSPSPKVKKLRDDQEFMGIVARLVQDHSLINNYMADPRMMELIQAVTRRPGQEDEEEEEKPAPPPKKPEPEPVKEMTPEELDFQNKKKQADEFKATGNAHYKKKEFAEALACYNKAHDMLPTYIPYMNNIAAVYLEKQEWETCIEWCDKAAEVGKDNRADFKDIGKALTRKGTCFHKQQKWDEAIAVYKSSMLEHRSADTLDKLKKCEEEKKKAAAAAYFSEEKCEEQRLAGNEHFKKQEYKEAIDLYSDAIKRNPGAHAVYSNRAAAYMKMGAYDDAEKDCKHCLKLEPTFAKAVIRLAQIYFFRKEYHKAMVEYQKGLEMCPESQECKDGLNRTMMKIQTESGAGGEDDGMRQQRAMADPEIQAILSDTYMQQVLREISENPKNFAHYSKSPDVMAKINKLIAAGIIKTA
eukprot:TRINITY_DN5323_c0_g1_i1.p1 TRINITY_DN5323_c0_g1~~TRINITY_DN5323_c0_g1_i1.p1  ORF type:complete len:550 (+),score=319.69 TRINITY_DN5323_c0_g1_i1:53-1702(+)